MFPVCTGMNREVTKMLKHAYNVPRMHGDEPDGIASFAECR